LGPGCSSTILYPLDIFIIFLSYISKELESVQNVPFAENPL
jgi:hypothetical protein